MVLMAVCSRLIEGNRLLLSAQEEEEWGHQAEKKARKSDSVREDA
jgi:hypothetical protein